MGIVHNLKKYNKMRKFYLLEYVPLDNSDKIGEFSLLVFRNPFEILNFTWKNKKKNMHSVILNMQDVSFDWKIFQEAIQYVKTNKKRINKCICLFKEIFISYFNISTIWYYSNLQIHFLKKYFIVFNIYFSMFSILSSLIFAI